MLGSRSEGNPAREERECVEAMRVCGGDFITGFTGFRNSLPIPPFLAMARAISISVTLRRVRKVRDSRVIKAQKWAICVNRDGQ